MGLPHGRIIRRWLLALGFACLAIDGIWIPDKYKDPDNPICRAIASYHLCAAEEQIPCRGEVEVDLSRYLDYFYHRMMFRIYRLGAAVKGEPPLELSKLSTYRF